MTPQIICLAEAWHTSRIQGGVDHSLVAETGLVYRTQAARGLPLRRGGNRAPGVVYGALSVSVTDDRRAGWLSRCAMQLRFRDDRQQSGCCVDAHTVAEPMHAMSIL